MTDAGHQDLVLLTPPMLVPRASCHAPFDRERSPKVLAESRFSRESIFTTRDSTLLHVVGDRSRYSDSGGESMEFSLPVSPTYTV